MHRRISTTAIFATLSSALLGGCSPSPAPDAPPASTADAAPPTADPTGDAMGAASADATPPAPVDAPPTDPPSPVAATELPGEREKPIAGSMPAEGSKRQGSLACCGKGTCGTCEPLPEKRSAPKAPKQTNHPAKKDPTKSTRTGSTGCCGAGTCGPC